MLQAAPPGHSQSRGRQIRPAETAVSAVILKAELKLLTTPLSAQRQTPLTEESGCIPSLWGCCHHVAHQDSSEQQEWFLPCSWRLDIRSQGVSLVLPPLDWTLLPPAGLFSLLEAASNP